MSARTNEPASLYVCLPVPRVSGNTMSFISFFSAFIFSDRRCPGRSELDVVLRDVSGSAGLYVFHLQPGAAHRQHGQLVTRVQAADRFGALTGLRPQADALRGLAVEGFRGHGVGIRSPENKPDRI